MNNLTLSELNKIKPQKIGNKPVVVLSLEFFERMKEDMEMYQSKTLPKEIAKARKEVKDGNLLSFKDVKKKLNLV